MDFGFTVEFNQDPGVNPSTAYEEAFAQVDIAEEMGLDEVWIAEHHSQDGFGPTAPLITAAAIATRTKRLRVGTAILILPLGHPLRFAEEISTIDQISHGRFDLGIGRSTLPRDILPYNLAIGESRPRLLEYLEIMKMAWTSETFSFQGQFYSFDNVRLEPKPYQKPHPPIRIAASTPDTYELVGRLGYPIFLGIRTLPIEMVAEHAKIYKNAWSKAGHKGAPDMILRLPIYVAASKQTALSTTKDSMLRIYHQLGSENLASAKHLDADAKEERMRRGHELLNTTWE
ncbi:LLM class flavin-dependent oxidoreductase, partial [SAR202 cluster bacterium AD-804-J14_MRT_500m]|nr:LLM class flavin-dependent oxidoreductase [SAR202 cluster bacterium AD-804-J14_MRT_500m]